MRTTRLLFDNSETPESIAQRIVRAFDPGETFCVKGKFFKVSGMRTIHETVRDNVVGDKYTLILNVGDPVPRQTNSPVQDSLPEHPISEPPPSSVKNQAPVKKSSESGEFPIVRQEAAKVTKEGPPKVSVAAGQVWVTKDQRRNTVFTIAKVDDEFLYTTTGGKISLKRIRNYRLVEGPDVVSHQSSG